MKEGIFEWFQVDSCSKVKIEIIIYKLLQIEVITNNELHCMPGNLFHFVLKHRKIH